MIPIQYSNPMETITEKEIKRKACDFALLQARHLKEAGMIRLENQNIYAFCAALFENAVQFIQLDYDIVAKTEKKNMAFSERETDDTAKYVG